MPLDKYERIWWRGHQFNRWTAAAIETWEDKLGAPLHISQGSFRPYTSYSGSSHMGGGAVDLWCYSRPPLEVVRVGRNTGFACWWRTPSQGNWPHHIHGILIGDHSASATAKWQVEQYKMGYNGLNGYQKDWQTYRPDPIREFNYAAWEDDVPLTKDEIDKIANAVWNRTIANPLTQDKPNDSIDVGFALNRVLAIVSDINKKLK